MDKQKLKFSPGLVIQLLVFIMLVPFLPLLLDSPCTFLPVIVMTIVLTIRTVLEDRTLQEELPGYKEYTQKARYRLIPGIW